MTPSKPNVVVLTLDAVRQDRTSIGGYHKPTTPVLEGLASDSIICEAAFSPATFTEIAFPALMTSSRPLSYGGYDHGALGRPPTLSRTFNDAGYHVAHLSNVHWINRFHGYGDGVHDEQQYFVLNTVLGAGIATMMSSLWLFCEGHISEEQMVEVVDPATCKIFHDLIEYCDSQIANPPPAFESLRNCGVVYDSYDYRAVKRVVENHMRMFEQDRISYIHRFLCPVPAEYGWMAADWRFCRNKWTMFRIGAARLTNRLLGLVNPSLALLKNNRRKQYADAAAMADLTINTIEKAPRDRPLFLWSHFMDAHMPYCAGSGLDWYQKTPDYLAQVGHDSNTDVATALIQRPKSDEQWVEWSALYDAAIRYIDEQIGRIFNTLERLGLAENTILAVTADHGEELGEHGYVSHYFRLYDHSTRVPMLFYQRGMGSSRIDGFTSTLDFAPTIAALAGVASPPGWEGLPVDSPEVSNRDYLVLETFFGGNCDFQNRPIYLGIRTRTHKYLWKEYQDPRDTFAPQGNELYDLSVDPMEQNNIYCADHPALPEFNAILAQRLIEIPEVTDDRIIDNFGQTTFAAAKNRMAQRDEHSRAVLEKS